MEDRKTYLITGAPGFIGRHMVQALLDSGATVYAVSRHHQSSTQPRHIPVDADLSALGWTERLPTPVDVVLHLAQSTRYREFPDGSFDMLRVNVDSTLELLEWARIHGVAQFLFASTGNVYRPNPVLHTEDDPCQPTSMYSATKLSAEYLVQQYAKYFRTVIVRLFGVYGPGQKDMVVPNMIDCVRTGKDITLAQGIGLRFTPIYVSDCVTMLQLLLDAGHNDISGEVYNVAGNEVTTLARIVELIAEHLHLPQNTRRTENTPAFLQGSITKICNRINYKPQVGVAKGVSRILQLLSL